MTDIISTWWLLTGLFTLTTLLAALAIGARLVVAGIQESRIPHRQMLASSLRSDGEVLIDGRS